MCRSGLPDLHQFALQRALSGFPSCAETRPRPLDLTAAISATVFGRRCPRRWLPSYLLATSSRHLRKIVLGDAIVAIAASPFRHNLLPSMARRLRSASVSLTRFVPSFSRRSRFSAFNRLAPGEPARATPRATLPETGAATEDRDLSSVRPWDCQNVRLSRITSPCEPGRTARYHCGFARSTFRTGRESRHFLEVHFRTLPPSPLAGLLSWPFSLHCWQVVAQGSLLPPSSASRAGAAAQPANCGGRCRGSAASCL